jgi:ATP-dependent DNA helicase RecQ
VLRGQREVRLLAPTRVRATRSAADAATWEGVDHGLFEHLREVRRELAGERGVPAYVVFGDVTLRELARVRPATADAFLGIRGVGERKAEDLGPRFLAEIETYCREHDLGPAGAPAVATPVDFASSGEPGRGSPRRRGSQPSNAARAQAFELFAARTPVETVCRQVARAKSTVWGYLAEWVAAEQPASLEPWLDDASTSRVEDALSRAEDRRLRPISDALGGEVAYEAIRIVVARAEGLGTTEADAD